MEFKMEKGKMLKCFLPFNELTVYTKNKGIITSPCCKISSPVTVGQITKIKKELHSIDKNAPKECNYCWNVEEQGLTSWRMYEGNIPEKWKNVNLLKHPRGKLIQFLKLAFDNTCDCACIYCDTHNSSIWNKEVGDNSKHVEQLLPYPDIYENLPSGNNNINTQIKWVKDFLEKTGSEIHKYEDYFNIAFLGGEPFLSPALRNGKFIEYIDSFYKHVPHDFCLIYEFNTNCNTPTALIDKNLKLIEQYKDKYINSTPKIILSGESYGKAIEYIRYGTNHVQYMENIEKYISKPWLQISLNLSMNAFSMPSLHKYLKFIFDLCKKYDKKIGLTPGCVYKPKGLHPCVLPNTNEIKQYVDDALNNIDINYINEHTSVDNINNVLNNLKEGFGLQDHLLPELKNYVKYVKIVRKQNIKDFIPELQFLDD